MAVILHLVAEEEWRARPSGPTFSPPSLATEGFVHCTAGDTALLAVANALYTSRPGPFLVLSLDEDLLSPEVRWEAPAPGPPPGTDIAAFPHVYGPLDVAAVVEVRAAVRDGDGRFVALAPGPDAARA